MARRWQLKAAMAAVLLSLACAPKQYRLDLLGGAGQGLSRLTSDKESEFGPSVSADGRTLLFDTRFGEKSGVSGIDPNTGARRTVYTSSASRAQEVSWDPTGRFFVYTSNSSGSWSLVRSISSSPNAAVAIIVSGEMAPVVSHPDVSPDGKKVAFSTRLRGTWSLAVSGLDGSNFTIMGEGVHPSWSPDGKRLAFVRATGGRAHVFSMDAETGTDVVQITTGQSDNFDPAWSPEGHRLVFSSNRVLSGASRMYVKEIGDRNLRSFATSQLFSVKPDGTGIVQLTDGEGMSVHPYWGRDGWIYFSSNQAGNFDIWRLRPTGELLAGAK